MRPKFSVWSDYGAPAQKPKILLATIVVAASIVGISAFYRQVIDPARVEHSPARLPKTPLSPATVERSGSVAAVPLPPPRAVTTGEAPIMPAQRTPASERSRPRSMVVAVEPPAQPETPPGIGDIPETQVKAEAPPAESASAVAAHSAERSPTGAAAKKAVMKRKVARVKHHHHHRHAVVYAQYGWWTWPGGSWNDVPPSGNFRRF
jgi:hypothetical protein